MNEPFVIENKVAKSGLITIDLEKLAGDFNMMSLDLKSFLFMDLLLKEKDFRKYLDDHDWSQYKGSILAVYCSSDAIIAPWAYMLVVTHASHFADDIVVGKPDYTIDKVFNDRLSKHDWSQYKDKRILLKGCSDRTIPPSAYALATNKLQHYAERIMYGEACSFVPVWRRPKN
ncbi:MAG: DUF2480 family protein [Bacteroidetes bacterium]|nr:DUF2480 family protein [Bacteroidota bacterium]